MKPYLSFVAAGRNDDFGGNFLPRLQAGVNSILALSRQYNLSTELLIMEWNPPADRPRLKDAIQWPADIAPAHVRIIEVPTAIHKKFRNSDKIPFFEFFAKNAGIRRAQGEYVLATNSDIVFSEEMMKFFASRRLADNAFFRADRYDVKINSEFFHRRSVKDQIQYCKDNVFRLQTRHGAVLTSLAERLRAHFWERLKNLNIQKIKNKLRRLARRAVSGPESTASADRFRGLYINAGGDFMLLSKKNWEYFKGYPELGVDRGLDCYMTIMCHVAGLLPVVLPYPIYHLEHDRSDQYLRPTAVLENIPAFEEMVATGKAIITNDKNWGLGNVKLKEFLLE